VVEETLAPRVGYLTDLDRIPSYIRRPRSTWWRRGRDVALAGARLSDCSYCERLRDASAV